VRLANYAALQSLVEIRRARCCFRAADWLAEQVRRVDEAILPGAGHHRVPLGFHLAKRRIPDLGCFQFYQCAEIKTFCSPD
jgi:hypothetical protein